MKEIKGKIRITGMHRLEPPELETEWWEERIADLETQLAAKTQECERLREDQKRLEWLVEKESFVEHDDYGFSVYEDCMGPYHDNWRDAIDEAMHNSGGGDAET